MKKIVFIILMLIFINRVNALTYGGCEYKEVTRMKSIVSNVNISYDYSMDEYNNPNFSVTINNISFSVF